MNETSYEIFFTALSGNRRLDIIQFLKKVGSSSVTDIASGTGIEQSAVSHNLSKLLACKFVHIENLGKQRIYSLNTDTIVPLLQLVDQHIKIFCSGSCPCCTTHSSLAAPKISSTGR